MWKILNKDVDWEESTSFLDHVYFDCTHRQCEWRKILLNKTKNHVWIQNFRRNKWEIIMFWKLRVSSWSYDMEDHVKKCVERIVSWRIGRLHNSTMCQLHASMTTTSKKKNWNPWENCRKLCSQIVPTYLYLARIGEHNIPWLVIKLARSITKRTKACDKRLFRLVFLHPSNMWEQVVLWNTLREIHCAFLEVTHTSVFTTSGIISLDARLMLDIVPPLQNPSQNGPKVPACSSAKTVPIRKRSWTDIEPEDYSPIANGRCSQIIKSQIGVSTHFDSSITTQMAKIMV